MEHSGVTAQVAIAIRRHYQGPYLGPEQDIFSVSFY